MEYKGKLYGKVNKLYFPLEATTDDWDVLEEKVKIIELEKRKYALGLLKELNNLIEWENGKMYNKLSTDIIVLEQEIANLEEEIREN